MREASMRKANKHYSLALNIAVEGNKARMKGMPRFPLDLIHLCNFHTFPNEMMMMPYIQVG